jgi:DNA polymerase I-like protein with 3'-5' exonuclease and polymerase domains
MLTVEDAKKFDWKTIPLADCLKGNAMDTFYTIRVFHKLLDMLKEKKLDRLYERLISPSIPVFRDMEYEGLLIDTNKLAELKEKIKAKITLLEENLRKSKGLPPNSNLNSDQHLVRILFSLVKNKKTKEWDVDPEYGFGLYPFNITDAGQPQTNDETLVMLRDMIDEEYVKRGLNCANQDQTKS